MRDGRDPLTCSASGGRWDDRTFDVLYTSLRADGAIAEVAYFHGRDGLMVPSARSTNATLAVFCARTGAEGVGIVADGGLIEWNAWRTRPAGVDHEP